MCPLLELGHPCSPDVRHRCSSFLGFWAQTRTHTIHGAPEFSGFRRGLNDTPGSPGSPACRQQTVGLHLRKGLSQFLL